MDGRNTIQRDLVLQAVRGMTSHPTADEVYRRVAEGHAHVSKATVYRNLAKLARQGAIRRVSHLDAADRFDFELREHYHFRCNECGGVFDVDMPYDAGLLARPNNPEGFLFEGCDVVFSGWCPACRAKAEARP